MPVRRDVTRRAEAGAVLVEAAMGFGVVFFAVFAIIEAGLLYSTSSTTSSAARSGARLAASSFATAGSKTTAADDIRKEVEADLDALTGFGVPERLWISKAGVDATCSTACFRFTWNGTAGHFGPEPSSPGWHNPDACGHDGSVDSITVRLTVRHRTSTDVLGDRLMDEHTTMRLEPLPSHQCP